MSNTSSLSRRAFLTRLQRLGIAGTAAPWALNLAAVGEAAAFTAGSDYKALVCIFLFGGNDFGNTIIPYDSAHHADYLAARSDIGHARTALGATALTGVSGLPSGRQFALAPGLDPLVGLFEQQKLAIQLNVGPLVEPTTLAQYKAKSVRLPPKLFSHNDQQSVWQSDVAEGSTVGWGGKIGDLALSGNGKALFTCMSVTGEAVFLAGEQALNYRIGSGGAVAVRPATEKLYGSEACQAALRTLMTETRQHTLENELNIVVSRSIGAQAELAGALGTSAGKFDAALPDSIGSLAKQLKMVARLIDASSTLGVKRQVFMVSLGGFDTHDNEKSRHAPLMTQLGQAMAGFQSALDGIGKGDAVTTFTASDFGRTMTSNGGGTDHGWGAHHFVMGGAVRGGAFYGSAPEAAVGDDNDVGQGRYIPSTSVDQYAATMARWMGVEGDELALVAPNIRNFSTTNLGFLG